MISGGCDAASEKAANNRNRDNPADITGLDDLGGGDSFPPLASTSGKKRVESRNSVKTEPYLHTKAERESSRFRSPSVIRHEMDDEDDVTPLRRSGRRRTKRFVSASDGEEEVEIVDKKLRPFAPPRRKEKRKRPLTYHRRIRGKGEGQGESHTPGA